MSTIVSADLFEILQQGSSQNVLDVRTPVEFAEVHLQASRNIPLDDLKLEGLHKAHGFSVEKPLYLICRSGQRARRAADKLMKEGFPNSIVVDGGLLAWESSGFPVIRGKRRAISLERQVRIGAGSLVLLGLILGLTVSPGFLGISGFVGAGLVFAGITDWCGMGLLLAKAPWNRKFS